MVCLYSICVHVALDEMKLSFSGGRKMNFSIYSTLLLLLVATFLSGKFIKTFYIKHLINNLPYTLIQATFLWCDLDQDQ